MSDDIFHWCMGPPCEHFPPGTTREQAREILAHRALKMETAINYIRSREKARREEKDR